MAYISIYRGIFFVEGNEPQAQPLGYIQFEKGHTFNAQLKSLDRVKDQLVEKVLALGGNAVVNFNYGQKSAGWFESFLFSLDDIVRWYGNGTAAFIPEERRQEILQRPQVAARGRETLPRAGKAKRGYRREERGDRG